jgi:hypothetical protein
VFFILAVVVSMAVSIPAAFASDNQTSTQTQNVDTTVSEEEGTATGRTAHAGAAVAVDRVVVRQHVVQHDGGNDNAMQNAEQEANVEHHTSAESGDADEAGGRNTESGNATAESTTVVYQVTIQVVGGRCGDGVEQDSRTEAHVQHETAATTGDAAGTDATSGDAAAATDSRVKQTNRQYTYCGSGVEGARR